jgi:hypothetical protein
VVGRRELLALGHQVVVVFDSPADIDDEPTDHRLVDRQLRVQLCALIVDAVLFQYGGGWERG